VLAGSRERAPHAKIAHVLRGLVDRHGWEAMTEGDNIIGAQVFHTIRRDSLGKTITRVKVSLLWSRRLSHQGARRSSAVGGS